VAARVCRSVGARVTDRPTLVQIVLLDRDEPACLHCPMGQKHASGEASERAGALRRISVLVGFLLAGAMFALRIGGSDLPISVSLPGALAFGAAAAIPPMLAVMAARDRFGLYAAAGFSATLLAFGMSVLGLVMLPLGIIWLVIYFKDRADGFTERAESVPMTLGVAFVVVSFAIGAYFVLFLHLDPRCVSTYTNGEVLLTPLDEVDMDSGWIWDVDAVTTGRTRSLGGNVLAMSCSSDVVTWPEAVASLALSSSALASGAILLPRSNDAAEIV